MILALRAKKLSKRNWTKIQSLKMKMTLEHLKGEEEVMELFKGMLIYRFLIDKSLY